MKKLLYTALKWAGVAAFWLLLWQIASMLMGSALLLPSPAATLGRLGQMMAGSELWLAVGGSLLRILIGFVCGMVLGCTLGAVTAFSPLLRTLFRPLMTIIKSTPVASFIILLLVLIPTGTVPSFTVVLMVTPAFWTNIYTGAAQTDPALLEMAKVFRLSRKDTLRSIYIPSIMPYFTSALTAGIGLAWKAGIAAEVICVTRNSIGKGLYESKIYLETEDLFAWTAVVIVMSLILENALVALINRLTARKRNGAQAVRAKANNR